ncbi:MAG TPA: GntR family transcriptional regulator [Amaricoccus sp.]|uniref:FadR/GntR family transcriptional regulator n=1 Tax=Amaricoccus sp. TaxID=1872485 RepID=UPI002CE448FC|nr:FCD domain-containing protein [Amaricoccus sp.]HMQ92823.1 GntR family transcriptional regulator [Amaricoccus sp.]HMR52845.1 GntR family transcriptional regulator [Amaricoccus sp.]HMR60391.1 GntR family transcriptional regulator [Amaricoccus sp.]HMT99780.1 GntR family transcriptional regulator [Amaricoccus sp.]
MTNGRTMDALTRQAPAERFDAVSALRALIADRPYAPGDRLPPERELIVSLGISRATLRKALDALEREGAIWRHVGKGTFVAGQTDGRPAGGLGMLSRSLTPVRMMRARLCIEPAIAREAAINASEAAIVGIRRAQDRARTAQSWRAYEAQDDALHRAIAEATDNILLLSLFDQLNQVRRAVAWDAVVRVSDRPPAEHPSFAEHDRIAAAIAARDPTAAQDAMRRHIGSVSARLFGEV